MAYSTSFHRLVMMGQLYDDIWNSTLSIANPAGAMSAVDETLLDDVATLVADWFEDRGYFTGRVILTGIKLNRINTSGHYADPDTMEHTYTTPIYGSVGGNVAPQLTMVSTLLTNLPRGRGSKGRMFLPPQAPLLSIGNDGLVTASDALTVATRSLELVTDLNALYEPLGASVVVASRTGAGSMRVVNGVRVGRVPDTMRSRRNKQPEDYQEVLI